MSFLPLDQMSFKDSAQLDAFGLLRVSQAETIFDSQQEYSSAPLIVENFTAGTATATHSTSTNSTVLSTAATTAANRAMRQTKIYWRYQPGKSPLAKMTSVLAKAGTPSGTAFAGIGYYDDDNGVFFGRDTTGYFVCRRSNVSGSVVNTKVYSTDWNLAEITAAGVTLDFTKVQIFVIDLQWLGAGSVRFGLQFGRQVFYVYEFEHANVATSVYIRTANLPLRAEVFNSGGTGSNISLEAICMALESEGGVQDEGGYTFCASTDGTSISLPNTATLTPILTLRCRDTFNGLTYRGHCHPENITLSVANQAMHWHLVWNASLTGASFANVDATYSGMEYDFAATAYTGGTVIACGYEASGTAANRVVGQVKSIAKLILARTYSNTRDTLTLVGRGLGGISTAYAAINFEEQY